MTVSVLPIVNEFVRNFNRRGIGFFAGNAHAFPHFPPQISPAKRHPFRNNVEFLRPEESVFLGHDAASVSDRLLTFRGEALASCSRVDRS